MIVVSNTSPIINLACVGLEKAWQPLGPMDYLIAGTALAHQAILVTHNTREFSRAPGLLCEDWY